jgi:hypothetical protein
MLSCGRLMTFCPFHSRPGLLIRATVVECSQPSGSVHKNIMHESGEFVSDEHELYQRWLWEIDDSPLMRLSCLPLLLFTEVVRRLSLDRPHQHGRGGDRPGLPAQRGRLEKYKGVGR